MIGEQYYNAFIGHWNILTPKYFVEEKLVVVE